MVQELARKTAKKMENQGVIASKTTPIRLQLVMSLATDA